MSVQEKISVCHVHLKPIPSPASGELSENIFRKCAFCEKNCEVLPNQLHLTGKLSGPGAFYCPFCLRHGLHTRGNRDVLVLSFRGILGHFYYQNYISTQNHIHGKMWISEIEDYIEAHRQTGECNPLFLYDPDTMLWFVNFARVGNSKKKVPVTEVHKTIVNILATFNLYATAPGVSMAGLYASFRDAVENFYRKRYRPENRRMLIPTLSIDSKDNKACGRDKARHFTLEEMEAKK